MLEMLYWLNTIKILPVFANNYEWMNDLDTQIIKLQWFKSNDLKWNNQLYFSVYWWKHWKANRKLTFYYSSWCSTDIDHKPQYPIYN